LALAKLLVCRVLTAVAFRRVCDDNKNDERANRGFRCSDRQLQGLSGYEDGGDYAANVQIPYLRSGRRYVVKSQGLQQ